MNGATPPGAIHDDYNGAGILCTQQSSPTIRNVVVTGSWAGCWGGAICCSFESHPWIERVRLVGNYVGDDGGGLFAWAGSEPVLVNSIIANNESRVTGGGVTAFSPGMHIINSTIVGNTAIFASGVYAGSNVTIENSIIWGNAGDEDVQGTPTISYSLVAGGFAGVGNINTTPHFADADAGDFRPAAHSPLIDRGHTDFVVTDTDADGLPRIVHATVDLGAHEFQLTPCLADVDGSGEVGFSDLLQLFGAWGVCEGCLEDVDRDGAVAFSDLLEMFSSWGACE